MRSFVRLGNKLYFIKDYEERYKSQNTIQYISSDVTDITADHLQYDAGKTLWYAETGDWGMYVPDSKYIYKMAFKLVSEGTIYIDIQYDGSGRWERINTIQPTKKATETITIMPTRCNFFRIKISGNNNCKIYSIMRTLEQGSDVIG